MAIETNSPNRMVAMILGAVLVLIGILGFFPALVWDGVTEEALLGIFGVNMLHNWIHILTGAVLLIVAFVNNGEYARMTNMVLGWIYVAIAVLGFVAPGFMDGLINSAPTFLNPDAFLHLLIAAVLLGVAYTSRTDVRRPLPGART